jgi:hypothetical protein
VLLALAIMSTVACVVGALPAVCALLQRRILLLPKTSSMLVGADARVWPMWPMLCAMAACGAFVRQGNAVAW